MPNRPTEAEKAEFMRGLEERNTRREASRRKFGLHSPKNQSATPTVLWVYTPLQWTPKGYERSPERLTPVGDTLPPAWPECGSDVMLEWVLEAIQQSEAARELGIKSAEARRVTADKLEADIVKKAKAFLLAGTARHEVAGIIASSLKVTPRHVRSVLKKRGI